MVTHRGEFCPVLLVSHSPLYGAELLEGWSLQQNEQRDFWPCQLVHCILNETMDGLLIVSDPDGSTSSAGCPQPRHGLVPGILGTGRNHFGIWTAMLDPLSMSQVTASNQQLEFDSWFLKEALMCPTKEIGSF